MVRQLDELREVMRNLKPLSETLEGFPSTWWLGEDSQHDTLEEPEWYILYHLLDIVLDDSGKVTSLKPLLEALVPRMPDDEYRVSASVYTVSADETRTFLNALLSETGHSYSSAYVQHYSFIDDSRFGDDGYWEMESDENMAL